MESADQEIRSRDLNLSPMLSSELSLSRDEKQSLSSASSRGTSAGMFSTKIEKPFASGTKVALSANHDVIDGGSAARFGDTANVFEWDARISQSLWRDALGRATSLRHNGEFFELEAKKFSANFEKQQFLINVESAYWDLVLALREERIRRKSIDRFEILERWTKRRIREFAAETMDLLQVQSFLSQCRLDLTVTKNSIEVAHSRIRQLIPESNPAGWTLDINTLEADRDPLNLMFKGSSDNGKNPLRLDALAALYRSQQERIAAQKTDDSLLPDLNVYIEHGANGIDNNFSSSLEKSVRGNTASTKIGLLFSMQLDGDLKNRQRSAARIAAESQESRAQSLVHESGIAWGEMQRNISNLRMQVKETQAMSALQFRKVRDERARYEQGRSNTLQMTTFEVDALESELRVYRLLANLRKAESSARSFAYEGGSTK